MKKAGISRPIDELGRIVVPMEIRKNLKIKAGDELEIFIDGSDIILRKHSKIGNFMAIANSYMRVVKKNTDKPFIIVDTDQVVVSTNTNLSKKKLASTFFQDALDGDNEICIFENEKPIKCYVNLININNEIIGALIVLSEEISQTEKIVYDMAEVLFGEYEGLKSESNFIKKRINV